MHGVDVSLLYRWRRQFARERETPAFVPVRVTPEPVIGALTARGRRR